MKRIALILSLFCISFSIYALDWKLGVSIRNVSNGLTGFDLFSQENIGFWPEEKVQLFSLKDGAKLIISGNYYPFGIVAIADGGKKKFLLDYNGDGILDCEPEYLFVPPWIVDQTSKGTDRGETIVSLFENEYDSFAGNCVPMDSKSMKEYAEKLVKIAKDVNSSDRIYAYFDYLYGVNYSRKEFSIAIVSLLSIEKITTTSINARSAWLVKAVECSYKLKDLVAARKYLEELIETSPSFVPGLYYQYLLESNPNKKDMLKSILLRDFSEHWIIKDRLLSTTVK